ncbi:MAG: hypothetical protein C4525_15515 [Desulfarculus sp.]|nr:MAG: hypothetical protein C4525_15515 [Desulfarculus sp.]
MSGLGYQSALLLLLTVLWAWGLIAFSRWRLRRRAARGKPADVQRDWQVQLALKGGGLLLLGLLALLVIRA